MKVQGYVEKHKVLQFRGFATFIPLLSFHKPSPPPATPYFVVLAWNHPLFFSLFSSLLLWAWIGVMQWKKRCIVDVFSSFAWTRQRTASNMGAERKELTCQAMEVLTALENKSSWSLHGALCGVGSTTQAQLTTGSRFFQEHWTTTAWPRGLDWLNPESETGFQTWKMLLLTRCLCTTHQAWYWFWQMKMAQIELSEILLWTSVYLSCFCLVRIKHVLNSLCVLKRTQYLWSTQTPKCHRKIAILALEQELGSRQWLGYGQNVAFRRKVAMKCLIHWWKDAEGSIEWDQTVSWSFAIIFAIGQPQVSWITLIVWFFFKFWVLSFVSPKTIFSFFSDSIFHVCKCLIKKRITWAT